MKAAASMATGKPMPRASAALRPSRHLPPDEGHGQGGQRAELGSHGHGADDGDRGVRDDADGRELGGQDQEGQIAPA